MKKLDITEEGSVSWIKVIGDIEFDDALEVNDIIRYMVEEGKIYLVFDFEKCSYIDSSGLGSLVEALKLSTAKGGDLRLCNLNSDIKDVLTMTRALKYFQIYNSAAHAISSFE